MRWSRLHTNKKIAKLKCIRISLIKISHNDDQRLFQNLKQKESVT